MTTIVALKCVDGVVLASDRRATKGGMIGSKGVKKIYPIDGKKAVAIAGQLSDANYLINLIKAEAKLNRVRQRLPANSQGGRKDAFKPAIFWHEKLCSIHYRDAVAGIDETGSQVIRGRCKRCRN